MIHEMDPNMGIVIQPLWCMCHLCMLLLARVLITQTSYFADILHNAPINAQEIFS